METPGKVATPLMAAWLRVPLKVAPAVPVPLLIATVMLSVFVVTTLLLASSTDTVKPFAPPRFAPDVVLLIVLNTSLVGVPAPTVNVFVLGPLPLKLGLVVAET